MSLEQDLLDLKAKGEKLNTLKIQNATKLASLEEEKNKLLAEAQELGIEPNRLEEVLRTEEAAVQEATSKLSEELNRVLDEVNRI
jgi:uncharacterized tellurite resistance protein B-like protein